MKENREAKMSDLDLMDMNETISNKNAAEKEATGKKETEKMETGGISGGNPGEKDASERKKGKTHLILSLVLLVAVMVLAFAGYQGYRYYKDRTNRKVQKISKVVPTQKEQAESAPEEIDWKALQALNPDIYAWIVVPNSNVNYPVLQSSENEKEDFYLMHQVNKASGYPGAIYSQKRNAKDFSDRMTVLYGHNMKNGTMFTSLHKYEDKNFFKENPYIYIYTPNAKYVYQVFAAYNYDDRLILAYFNDFKEDDVWNTYLKSFQQLYKGNVDNAIASSLTSDDKILTLSTCNNVETERFLVQGILLTEDEAKKAGIDHANDAQNMAAEGARKESGSKN